MVGGVEAEVAWFEAVESEEREEALGDAVDDARVFALDQILALGCSERHVEAAEFRCVGWLVGAGVGVVGVVVGVDLVKEFEEEVGVGGWDSDL